MKNAQKIVVIGLLIALQIVLTRFFSIQTPIVRIGFQFLPLAITSMLFGPLLGGVAAAVADLIGIILFPVGGAFFPGFTVSAFLTGFIYGLFLYKKPITWVRILLACATIAIFVDLVLNSYWLTFLTGNAFIALLPPRIIKTIAMIPIQLFTIQVVWNRIVGKTGFAKAIES